MFIRFKLFALNAWCRWRFRRKRKTYAETILADNPIAYYRLNETAGSIAFDSSGNSHHATIEEAL